MNYSEALRGENKSLIHQSPAIPTTTKTIRDRIELCPPNKKPTKSKRKRPIKSQFSAPIMAIVKAVLSILKTLLSFFSSICKNLFFNIVISAKKINMDIMWMKNDVKNIFGSVKL